MTELIGTLRRARNVCAILLSLLAAGCSAWRPLPGAGLGPSQSERLGNAKVFMRDGTELELDNATVRPDSIIGFGGETRTRLAVARSDVTRVDARQPDDAGTFVLGCLTTLFLAFLGVATLVALLSREGT